MIKKQLSSNLIAEKIVFAIALIIIIFFLIAIPEIPTLFPLIALIFIGYGIYTIYFVVSNISYDDSYVYIKNRKQDKVVELKRIIQIKLTPYKGSWRQQWKIKYLENGMEESLFFYLKYGLISLRPFIKIVKSQNPSVDCVYITLDVDFD